MAVHLSRNHHQQLLDWAQAAAPAECCGILRGVDGRVISVQRTDNVVADNTRHFEIDPAALIAVHKDVRNGGAPLFGYFHSHPNGRSEPSTDDVAQAAADGSTYLIIARGEISAWQPVVFDGQVTGFSPVALILEG
jgi:proteasome lid subunit RPN8/RPN11